MNISEIIHTSETMLDNKNYMSFLIGNQYLGKIVFNIKPSHIFIHYIYIGHNFRGQGYLNLMINNLQCKYNKDLILEAKESNDKYNHLVKHYKSLGFVINGPEHFEYEGEILFRKVSMIKSSL